MRDLAIDATRPRAPKQDGLVNGTVKRRVRKTGTPPPVTFDLDALPASSWLTTEETAAVLRKAIITVALWRRNPAHPLRWRRVDGRPLYQVGWVRAYIARDK